MSEYYEAKLKEAAEEIKAAESAPKTATDIVLEFQAAYESIRVFEKAARNRLRVAAEYYKAFAASNGWFRSKYSWLPDAEIRPGNITDEGIFFQIDFDDEFISFEELDNFSMLLEAEVKEAAEENSRIEARFKAERKAALEKELAALEEN